MEKHDDQPFDFLNARFLLAAFAVVLTLSFVSGAVFGADKMPRVEKQLDKVAAAMRDNVKETEK